MDNYDKDEFKIPTDKSYILENGTWKDLVCQEIYWKLGERGNYYVNWSN